MNNSDIYIIFFESFVFGNMITRQENTECKHASILSSPLDSHALRLREIDQTRPPHNFVFPAFCF